jgi:hypothetical protein
VEVWSDNKDYIITLMPKSRQRFSLIELYVDKASQKMEKTVLKEPKGDTTTVTMTED